MEGIGAIATIALAIVALGGIYSVTLAAIATIVMAVSIMVEGGSTAGFQQEVGTTEPTLERAPLGGEAMGGLAGIVLGILALLGVASIPLISVAVLVFGGTFLIGSIASVENKPAAAGSQVMVGVAGVVLGILAVVGINPVTLVLVGLLVLGGGALFGGSAMGLRSMSYAHTHKS